MARDRKRRKQIKQKKKKDPGFEFRTVGVPIEYHAEFKATMLTAARAGVAEFPSMLETLKKQLTSHDPLGIVASFAAYGLRSYVSDSGVEQQKDPQVLQHHAELLQAIMLSIPLDQWGVVPVIPPVMQTVFDTVPRLTEAFHFQHLLEGAKVTDKTLLLVRSLQERISMHTHGVRNWGYYSDVVEQSKELFSPLDPALHTHFGFSASDLVEILRVIVAEFERRQSEHFNILKKVYTGKNLRQMARHYFKYVPGLQGTPEAFVAAIPNIDRKGMMAMIMSHFDLRLAERATFTAADLAGLTGLPEAKITAALKAIALKPGDLSEAKAEYLFLDNPVWERPVVDLGEFFFIPVPQMAFSHIHRIMDRVSAEAGLRDQLSYARSRFLENKLEEIFRRALPGADIRSSVKWTVGDQQFETDLLVIIDRTVVIAEAKSNRLTPEGLRGAPDRVRRHINDIVLAPSLQSARLAKLIEDARRGDPAAVQFLSETKLNQCQIDRVIRISVTLDDLSILTSAEEDFKSVGWVPADHELAPTILISDLGCIIDILTNPLQVLHYLAERSFFQKSFDLLGDELDFLGLYLMTGFNLAAMQCKGIQFVPSGMSAPLDRYYNSRDVGIKLPKPKMKLRPTFSRIITHLAHRRPPGWTTIGLHLLSCADPSEQALVEGKLEELRSMVRQNFRNPQHLSSLQIQPPEDRKARVMFFLFPHVMRASVRQNMERLAAEVLEGGAVEACVVFGRCIEHWDRPYDAVLMIQADPAKA